MRRIVADFGRGPPLRQSLRTEAPMTPSKLLVVLLALVSAATPVAAQLRSPAAEATIGGSFITPFPENETYRIQVYGGVFADLLAKRSRR